MLNIDPEKRVEIKDWNANTQDERLGFIFRDKNTTEAQSTPMVIPRLGYDYVNFMSRRDTPAGAPGANKLTGTWRKTDGTSSNVAVPGILVYDFVPLFAQSTSVDAEGHSTSKGEVPDIFVNVWTRLRRLNNMTEKFMPSDVQWIYCGYMEILTHISNIRRILEIMQRVVQSSKSDYIEEETLVAALGFPMSATDMRFYWQQWRNQFNVSLVGDLRSQPWFTNLVPGFKRWAGLCKEIYKDDPNRTDYTQLYMFRPRYVWYLAEDFVTIDPDLTDVFSWKMEAQEYTADGTGIGSGPIAFTNYIDKIHKMIRSVFYSDSASLVIATINAIDARNWKEDQKMVFENIDLEEIPFDLKNGDYPFTYDFKVMLALHNATILRDADSHFNIEAPQQDWRYNTVTHLWETDGVLSQQVWLYNGEATHTQASGYQYNLFLAGLNKAINLPWYNPTMEDIINATQWTVVSNSNTLNLEKVGMHPEAAGTELLVRETLVRYKYTAQESGATIRTLQRINTSGYHVVTGISTEDSLDIFANFNSFALYPIVYTAAKVNAGEANEYREVIGIMNQEDVVYSCNEHIIQPLHAQFIRNFWGYPFVVGDTASGPHGES